MARHRQPILDVMALMTEFGEYLRRRRAELQPADVGLPDTAFRRVQGLRREEVAQLAGVSTDYYTRLEQGRDLVTVRRRPRRPRPRPRTRRRRPGAPAAPRPPGPPGPAADPGRPAGPAHRAVDARRLDRPARRSSSAAAVTYSPPTPWPGRCSPTSTPCPTANATSPDGSCSTPPPATCTSTGPRSPPRWSPSSASTPAPIPTTPAPPNWSGSSPLKSPEFSRWWSQHKVLDRTWGHKRFSHPVVGPLEIDYEALHLPGDPDQTLFVYRAPDGDTRSAEALTLLASWNARTHHTCSHDRC